MKLSSKYYPLYLTTSLVSFAQFLAIFRLCVVGIMLIMMLFQLGTFGYFAPQFFIGISIVYAVFAATIIFIRSHERVSANEQLANSLLDITFLTTLTGISGGIQTGITILTLIVMGFGAGLCSKTGWKLLALWSIIATFISEYIRINIFQHRISTIENEYLPIFFIGVAFVVTGAVANFLGLRLRQTDIENEIHQRKLDLQLRINELMLKEMEEAVIIVNNEGKFIQINRQTQDLLVVDVMSNNFNLRDLSARLYNHFTAWQNGGSNECDFRQTNNRNIFKARFSEVPASNGIAVVFIEDMEKVRNQAQRMKMSALGLLTANIAHEIRNPLSAIYQAAELLQVNDESEFSPELKSEQQLVQIILEHSGRIDKIIRDVSELSKRDRVKKEKFLIITTIKNIIDNFISIQNKNDITTYNDDIFTIEGREDIFIEFDVSHFHQVINNLLNNAWVFCKKIKGSIRIIINLQNLQQEVSISIIDDGVGITPESAVKVFEPFFTTRSQGTGIGLFVSRELCEANNGALLLNNNAPGAFFEIIAPGGQYNS